MRRALVPVLILGVVFAGGCDPSSSDDELRASELVEVYSYEQVVAKITKEELEKLELALEAAPEPKPSEPVKEDAGDESDDESDDRLAGCSVQLWAEYCGDFGQGSSLYLAGQCTGVNTIIPGWCLMLDVSTPCFGYGLTCQSVYNL